MIGQLPNQPVLGSANPSLSINLKSEGLHLAQRPRATSEAFGLDAEFAEHGEVEVSGGQFTKVHFSTPTGVGVDARSRLVFLIALPVLEVLTVLETELATADQQQRIIAR